MSAAPVQEEALDDELVSAVIPDEIEAIWVTAEMAKLWLTRNKGNRPIRQQRVNTLARDMAMDHWRFTGEAVKFSETGRLIDGQHRLLAQVKANKTIKYLVVPNLPDENQAYMDAGARRTAGDAFNFRGEINATLLASSVRLAILISRNSPNTKLGVSNAELIEWLSYNPEIRRSVKKVSTFHSKLDTKPSVMAYAHWRMACIQEEQADDFLMDLVEMRSEGPGDPIYTLLQRLRTARQHRERLSSMTELSFITRTWNAIRMRQQLRQLKIPSGEMEVTPFL